MTVIKDFLAQAELYITIPLFIVGLLALIKGGDWFVDGAVGVAHRFRLPELLIGATVVSIGTTLPEVMVSALGAAEGNGSMAYGNAIGSVICNTALIAALSVAIKPSSVDRKTLLTPVAFFFAAAAFYSVTAYATGNFSRVTGLILLAVFLIYMVVTVRQAIKTPVAAEAEAEGESEGSLARFLLLLVIGAAVIAVGAFLLVETGTNIAHKIGVPDSVIALTFVALGTSLPELVTAVTSLVKGHSSLSLGNVIGANLFNLVLVSGLAITINPFDVPAEKLIGGMNSSLVVDVPLMLFVMAFMTLPALLRGKLARFQGIVLLLLYAAFCAYQFVL